MKTTFVMCVFTLGFATQTVAKAEVEILWENPETYTDVRSANQSRKRFREATFSDIEEYMQELAADLPDTQKLVIKVTNLDLAGQVWPASHMGLGQGHTDVRIIKNIDIPRMNFSYQLLDQKQVEIKQAEVKLKDMSFMDRSSHFFKSDALRYEKSMLKSWFESEFASELNLSNKRDDTHSPKA